MREANPHDLALEPEAQAFVEGGEIIPYLATVAPTDKRRILDEIQSIPSERPDIDEKWIMINGGPTGDVKVRIIRPRGSTGTLPVVLYLHGGGWSMGSATTHDRLVRQIAVRAGIALAFPEYDLAPEAKYPIAIEQCWTVAQWIADHGQAEELDSTRMAIAGEQMGGNLAAALTILAAKRGGVSFVHQALLYPCTDCDFDTESYRLFGEGYTMRADGNIKFWDDYLPDLERRKEVTASPLRATLDELAEVPPAFVATAEADCLRSEGEAYAAKLRRAGVPVLAVRYYGIANGFMMLDSMRNTLAARAATAQTAAVLKEALWGQDSPAR